MGDQKTDIRKEFSSPSAAYRGKPFWSWNGELRSEELIRQANVMKEMGLGGYFMHSRAGLITEYLGEEWFKLINDAADCAEENGMEAWLYDEDRWPSGSAGGKVSVDPKYRMKSLYVYNSAPDKVDWNSESFALFIAKADGINLYFYKELDVSDVVCRKCAEQKIRKAIDSLEDETSSLSGEWRALRFAIVPDKCDSNYNGATYIDTMSREAVDKFIEITHEQYAKHCGDRLGKSIKGIFTDEPHRGHCFDNLKEEDGTLSCAVAWTDDIFEEYEKRYHSSCREILPELFFRKNGEAVSPVKLHYIDLSDDLFIERFAIPIYDWCKKHGIIFTGHVLHEDSLMNQTVPAGSVMRFYEYMEYPGVDCLTEHNRCYWIVKQLSSAARQLGKKWLLSELYGCTGWHFNFKSHKAVGDWQALFGINLRCHHLSWYTMEGESKRDYPASILHQSPWYKDYRKVEDYFARFGVVMSEGDADCSVLLLNPVESVWCQAYAGWSNWISNTSPDIAPYEQRYAQTFHMLADNQIDFDYGEEEMMSRMASVEKLDGSPVIRVGRAIYKTVIVTNMLTIRPTTIALLKEFTELGGKVIFAGDLPKYVDAVESDEPLLLSRSENAICIPFEENSLVRAVRDTVRSTVRVLSPDGETDRAVFAQVRKNFDGDGYAAVILNTDRDGSRRDITVVLDIPSGYRVEEWDLESGDRFDISHLTRMSDGKIYVSTYLEAAGTRCFVMTQNSDALPTLPIYENLCEETLTGEFPYFADEKNVCVLDFCKWSLDGSPISEETEVLFADRAIRSTVGIEWRGGEMLQPWFAKLHDNKCLGKLLLSYDFYVDKLPSGNLFLAGERPEFNTYKINGTELFAGDVNDFWIDDCFKKMPIPDGVIKEGRNEVTVEVDFKRTTNVEALYLVGDFGVRIDGRRRTLTSLPSLMGCDNYAAYDMPFFTGNLSFVLSPSDYRDILGAAADTADRIVLSPKDFTGGCVKVSSPLGETVLGWDPYEADITEAYRASLPITVTVEGVRTNLFGPLHETIKPAPICGPGSFVTSGADRTDDGYSLLSSGLRGFIFKAQKKIK